jgi:NhaA family Na+:H+ antiporter
MSVGAAIAVAWSLLNLSSYRWLDRALWHSTSVHLAVENGLLTLFFLAVGAELGRDLATSETKRWHRFSVPLLTALGGMLVPAALALVLGHTLNLPSLAHGWGVPMATDVAFVLAAVSLAGPRVPVELRLFLLLVALCDDVLSLAALAGTGAAHVELLPLVGVLALIAALLVGRQRTTTPWLALLMVPVWLALNAAGTEPALAGVVVGALLPVSNRLRPLDQWSQRLSTIVVLPLFALCACGIDATALRGGSQVHLTVVFTLVRVGGKCLGIVGGYWLARRLIAPPTGELRGAVLWSAGLLCAMGFTVPLLFAAQVFGPMTPAYSDVTVGLLLATVIGGGSGIWLVRRTVSRPRSHRSEA